MQYLNITIADLLVNYIEQKLPEYLDQLRNFRVSKPRDFNFALNWVFEHEPEHKDYMDAMTSGEDLFDPLHWVNLRVEELEKKAENTIENVFCMYHPETENSQPCPCLGQEDAYDYSLSKRLKYLIGC